MIRVRFLLGTPENVVIIRLMKNKAVKIGIFASVLPHLFCCGLPILMSVVGLIAPDAAHLDFIPHSVEPWIFVLSGLMLALSWTMVLGTCACDCEHCAGPNSHRVQKWILGVITVVFVISILLHIAVH